MPISRKPSLAKVRVGQRAELEFDPMGGKDCAAHVASIGSGHGIAILDASRAECDGQLGEGGTACARPPQARLHAGSATGGGIERQCDGARRGLIAHLAIRRPLG